jgi:hypothetical protein
MACLGVVDACVLSLQGLFSAATLQPACISVVLVSAVDKANPSVQVQWNPRLPLL